MWGEPDGVGQSTVSSQGWRAQFQVVTWGRRLLGAVQVRRCLAELEASLLLGAKTRRWLPTAVHHSAETLVLSTVYSLSGTTGLGRNAGGNVKALAKSRREKK